MTKEKKCEPCSKDDHFNCEFDECECEECEEDRFESFYRLNINKGN